MEEGKGMSGEREAGKMLVFLIISTI